MTNQINLNCPVNASTGYGITSTNIAISLNKIVGVSLFPIGPKITLDNEQQKESILEMLNRSTTFDKSSPCVKIWHQHDLALRIGNGDYYVMPFFEIDKLQKIEIHQINQSEGIFTPTKWSKQILLENGVNVPIYVCPLGVNLDIFKQNSIKIESENYVFLHVGKWELRKSQDFLLKSFEAAFSEHDDVELHLMPENPFLNEKELEQWHDLVSLNKLSKKIKLLKRVSSQEDVATIMSHADCGVFLSRAEGWNNEIPEMMAMNRPIIATNYSAHTEYCTTKNSFLVDVDETEPANDGKWFHGQGNWAKLGEKQLEQTVEHMRFVYNNSVRTNPNGVETAKLYSWDNTASVIHQTLLENDSYNVK